MATEAHLNRAGLLVWQWWWFKWPYALPQLLVFYVLVWFFLIRLYDAEMSLSDRWKIVGAVWSLLAVGFIVFALALKWA